MRPENDGERMVCKVASNVTQNIYSTFRASGKVEVRAISLAFAKSSAAYLKRFFL